MILLALLGILVNGAAAFRLKKGNTINERVVSLHLLEDVLGWAAILIGAVVMSFVELPIIDPIMSIAIACYVLFNVYKNIKQSFRIILQGTPQEVSINEVGEILNAITGVENMHDLHLWSIDGNYNVLTVHIVIKKAVSMPELSLLKNEIRKALQSKNIEHVTIEFETEDEHCSFEKCSCT